MSDRFILTNADHIAWRRIIAAGRQSPEPLTEFERQWLTEIDRRMRRWRKKTMATLDEREAMMQIESKLYAAQPGKPLTTRIDP